MKARWLIPVLAGLVLAPVARAQDDAMKAAIDAQKRHVTALAEADIQKRLNRKLIQIARKFWLSAKADGLKFEDVVENIGLRNAAMAESGLPLQVIDREVTDEFAITSRTDENQLRSWISLSGTSPDSGIDITAIDGDVVTGRALTPAGEIDPACRYRVVFANEGEHDERGHDDYAKDYACVPFLAGDLDGAVIADLKRWAADLVRRTVQ